MRSKVEIKWKILNTAEYDFDSVCVCVYVCVCVRARNSSSSNNIQDQCLIITDIYGVREKGGVAGREIFSSKNLTPNPNSVTGLPAA